jgi:hypothetical protein
LIERPDEAARGAEHTAGYLDNRHVEIVCAASARVNVSVLYQFVDTAKRPWPTSVARGRVFPGRAALGSVVLRKMACRPAAGETFAFAVQGHRLALEGQSGRCPFLIRSGNGRQDAQPCFARRLVILLHRRRLDLGLRYFGFSLFCARWSRRSRHSREALGLTWTKIILRSSAPQPRARPASGATTTTM